MILRDSTYKGDATLGQAIEWAKQGRGRDKSGYRKDFVELMKKARQLQ